MIDPLLSLTFNLQANKGTYALLIGSGVSRSASVPTGWEITLDLISKLAHLEGDDIAGDEAGWYVKKYGKEPSYSELLPLVAPTSAAQQQLLKSYFEPTEEEREEGKKRPALAQKAIAKLVRSGYIRVIVTTNFDRLLETAIEAEGVIPVVISSSDAAKGAPPLAHSKCTIIKVHGDYLDHRIKNSRKALAKYDQNIDQLLDRVFDEYGLIICGWSAEYDIALKKALERSKSRRYPMYWTDISKVKHDAKSLIALHKALFIKIDGADSFFTTLLEKVEALEEFGRTHLMSTQVAIATLKKYLSEDKFRIPLHDFLINEAKQVKSFNEKVFLELEGSPSKDSTLNLMKKLEAGCEILTNLFAQGSYYSEEKHSKAFFDAFHLVGNVQHLPGSFVVWENMKNYPALLLVYATGVSAIASENFSILKEIAGRPSILKPHEDRNELAPSKIYNHNILDRDQGRQLLNGMENRRTPLSDYLLEILREPLASLIPVERNFIIAFDNFEYLWCLLHVDADLVAKKERLWAPYGAFIWRRRHNRSEWLRGQTKKAVNESDNNFLLLKAGLFGGSMKRFSEAFNETESILLEISKQIY